MLARSLSTLKGTYLFMIAFGLLMGVVFPFYSSLFFGVGAFTPLYVAGCLVAGFSVGSFCFLVIKRVLSISLERQYDALGAIVSIDREHIGGQGTDHLQTSMTILQELLHRIERLITTVTDKINRITPRCLQLADSARSLTDGNSRQVDQVRETVTATRRMNTSFGAVLADVEKVSALAEERTAITAEMSGSISSIADMVEQYNGSVRATSGAVDEIAADLQRVSAQVDDLSGATEGAASSISEISASINAVRDHASATTAASLKVQDHAREGIAAVELVVNSMKDIDAASRNSVETITRLTQHSSKIGTVLDIITDIVEQTNLLSLNASIIAAQAGEGGRAFAVVAEEIRSLAQRTAISTREIAELVEGIQSATGTVEEMVNRGMELAGGGVHASKKAHDALEKIAESATEAAAMVRRIADATVEQASGSTAISRTTEQNLERFQQVRRSILSQEERIRRIVASLHQMNDLSQRIASASRNQAKANQQYLKSVIADNERAKGLMAAATEQQILGQQVGNFLEQAQTLIVANAEESCRILADVENIGELSNALNQALDVFSASRADRG